MAEIKSLISLCLQVEGMLRIISERDSAEGRQALADVFETFGNGMNAFLGVHVVEPDCHVAPAPVAAMLIGDSAQERISSEVDSARKKMDSEIEVDDDEEISVDPESTDADGIDIDTDDYGLDVGHVVAVSAGEAIAGHRSGGYPHLAQAFTVNDRFRFSRELFGGDVDEFADTVEVLSGMDSYKDAEDYLINDLAWDAESPEVAEFLEIVGNCMQG